LGCSRSSSPLARASRRLNKLEIQRVQKLPTNCDSLQSLHGSFESNESRPRRATRTRRSRSWWNMKPASQGAPGLLLSVLRRPNVRRVWRQKCPSWLPIMVDNAAGVGGTPLPFCGASGEDYEKSLSETAVYQSEAVQGRTSPIRRGNPGPFRGVGYSLNAGCTLAAPKGREKRRLRAQDLVATCVKGTSPFRGFCTLRRYSFWELLRFGWRATLVPLVNAALTCGGSFLRLQEGGQCCLTNEARIFHPGEEFILANCTMVRLFGAMQESVETWACKKPLFSPSPLH
jgi:hypothetical protein